MSGPTKRNAGVAPGGFVTAQHLSRNNKSGRAEAQGIKLDRNPSQRPPRWPRQAGADAADLLERLLGGRGRR